MLSKYTTKTYNEATCFKRVPMIV